MSDYRSRSFWLEACGDDLTPRPALGGDLEADVAIVGAGYTGLWTAYYLSLTDPGLRVAIVEAEIAGFGASGRNGGWCSALFAASRDKIAKQHGRAASIAMQKAMFETVDEVGRAARAEGIDAHFIKGGTLTFASAPAHVERLRAQLEDERRWGFGEGDYMWLDPSRARERIALAGCLGAIYTPHCARLQPASLARGLARAVESRGVAIYEGTPALSIERGRVRTSHGDVRAEVVVRATEGYTPLLPGQRRALAPLYSLMIATEPLPADFWDEVGWSRRETFTDGRHLIIYAQRTADDRIALGGRGAPYHYGSSVTDSFDRDPKVFSDLEATLKALLPGAAGARITHRWGGPLGVPRDWYSSVGYDRSNCLAWAGGYVGDGVSTSNLAGRTLADLICENDSDVTTLPWVNHHSRRWEVEPLRWLGTNGALWMMSSADRAEARTGRPARRAALIKSLIGM
ncbi:MAG: NAD(P)/FAD-dependent oxidoreductase [Actinomycetota bacterium]